MAHPSHPKPIRANRTIASTDPSIFRRTRERPASGNADPSPPVNGTGPLIKGVSGRAIGPEGTCPRIHTRTATLDKELCEFSRVLPGRGETDFLVNGDVAASHWPLQSVI